ncbi:hypothetical protein KUTeg_021564 [Tegillarca granosa]|uniref:Transmembrane protein n=1 Tax=Tegillarca granosa TaxID=220873 RepID=A0ABQ9E968_TEGGR|nr:hypothetical protein KUTeg_021564 [Tegillarca granosa]
MSICLFNYPTFSLHLLLFICFNQSKKNYVMEIIHLVKKKNISGLYTRHKKTSIFTLKIHVYVHLNEYVEVFLCIDCENIVQISFCYNTILLKTILSIGVGVSQGAKLSCFFFFLISSLLILFGAFLLVFFKYIYTTFFFFFCFDDMFFDSKNFQTKDGNLIL